MLKCQFHCHTSADPFDNIPYSPEELIREAARLKYDVVSMTHHRTWVFSEQLKKYAETFGILLIPGIEFEIDEKHILGINVDKEILKVDSYKKLKEYKKSHPDALIIAAHPFFPGTTTLKKELIENIEVFDAIENSFCYTKSIDFNKKGKKAAEKYKKPFVATSDCHVLKYLNLGYTKVDAKKDPAEICKAVKLGKIKNSHSPISLIKVFEIVATIAIRNIYKMLQSGK